MRDGSARSIRSRHSGASGVSLDTRRGLLGHGSVVWSPYELQALRRRRRAKRGRLHVSGVPLPAEATRERRRLETQGADAGLRADRTARFGDARRPVRQDGARNRA